MQVLIVPTTAAATSYPFVVHRGDRVGVKANGLADAEVITLQYQDASGAFVDDEDSDLTATEFKITITASGVYRVVKPTTASAAGVAID